MNLVLSVIILILLMQPNCPLLIAEVLLYSCCTSPRTSFALPTEKIVEPGWKGQDLQHHMSGTVMLYKIQGNLQEPSTKGQAFWRPVSNCEVWSVFSSDLSNWYCEVLKYIVFIFKYKADLYAADKLCVLLLAIKKDKNKTAQWLQDSAEAIWIQ